jgi:hypothetical protein
MSRPDHQQHANTSQQVAATVYSVPQDFSKSQVTECGNMNELTEHFRRIELQRWRLAFSTDRSVRLPAWLGSAWRGLFGHALADAVCTCSRKLTGHCSLKSSCPYLELFEPRSRSKESILHTHQSAPAPYVLRGSGGGETGAGHTLDVSLTLFGQARRHAGLALRALMLGATQGIGREAVPLKPTGLAEIDLLGVAQEVSLDEIPHVADEGATPIEHLPPWPGQVALEFTAPLRMRLRNRYIGPADLSFGDLFAQLLRRASLLRDFHCAPRDDEHGLDFRAWVALARDLDFSASRLEWHDLARHSSRQGRKVPMGGLVGDVVIAGNDFEPFWPLVWLGQHLGVGKGATMGLGQYRCKPC